MNTDSKIQATGRRKNAIARVTLEEGDGRIIVNGKKVEEFFPRETLRMIIRQPLEATNTAAKFNIKANVTGGGISGQAGAIKHGISRALVKTDEKLKLTLKKGVFLTRDPRAKERKKYGQKGARKRFQWTKR